ncbi:MAG: N-acetylmuramoyl-L-alanine amidase CwlC [Bacillus sp. (in: firmicutes)]|jgi:N-acetylmuramoyl-L-alanine amidase|nr:N-acetylmuramoyl-L-alanine amidase CwlC [Bacillus sp. (in: firmicutes)]
MKIMLDAGHGYNTAGKASPDGMREYEFNRACAAYAKAFLEGYQNVTVYYAHSDQTDVPLQQRTNSANNLKVDFYVSIHANAYGTSWNNAGGIETYVYITKPPVALAAAQKIQNHLIAETGLQNRGVKTADFHVLRETNMDAVLVECGFMTNPEEIKLLRSEDYRRTCADAIVKGVAEQFGLAKKPTPVPPPTPAPSTGIYKVQVGAFKQRDNANSLAARLEKDGFQHFVFSENGLFKVQAGAFKDKQNADELLEKLRNAGYQPFVYRD